MKITQFKLNKFATAGLLAASVLSGFSVSLAANAALVSGNATLTIDNSAVIASMPVDWYFETHWGASDNTLGIGTNTPGGTTLPLNGPASLLFPVNGAPNAIPGTGCPGAGSSPCVVAEYPTAGTYGRTIQATTMDASNTSIAGQQIGLSGGFRMRPTSGTTYLGPYDLSLVKYGNEWNVRTYDTSFTYANLFKLGNVSETLNGNGELLLTGDLYWSAPFAGGLLSWSQLFTGADPTTKLGSFSLAPTAVPLPAAVWLFGGALMGVLGVTRKKLNY
jgi:hypothetical protein